MWNLSEYVLSPTNWTDVKCNESFLSWNRSAANVFYLIWICQCIGYLHLHLRDSFISMAFIKVSSTTKVSLFIPSIQLIYQKNRKYLHQMKMAFFWLTIFFQISTIDIVFFIYYRISSDNNNKNLIYNWPRKKNVSIIFLSIVYFSLLLIDFFEGLP